MKFLSLILACIFSACMILSCSQKNFIRKESLCTAAPNGDTVVLDYNKPVWLFEGCRDKIQVAVNQVTDSRCPVDVTCIWAGKVNVLLQVSNDFSLNLEKGKLVDTTYMGRHYSFNVIDVTPAPNSKAPVESAEKKTVITILRSKS